MRSRWMAWAVAHEGLPNPTAKALLMILADHADDSGFCRPSIERLGRLACADPRTVQRQLKTLEALGLIRRETGGGWVQKSGDRNQGRASSYQLVGDPALTVAEAKNHPGTMSPKIEATPANCHLGSETTPANCHPRNRYESTLPRQIVTLTEVRETEGGGGARAPMHEREPARGPVPTDQPRPEPGEGAGGNVIALDEFQHRTRREELLMAMGHENPNAISVRGRIAGNREDMAEADRWTVDLGLTHAEQLSVIRDAMASKRDPGPPTTFSYFNKPMARLAGEKARPCLQPIYPTENTRERAYGNPDKRDRFQRIIAAASEGTSGEDWG
jgi:DNA-binding transcriptional ArsR family regulator